MAANYGPALSGANLVGGYGYGAAQPVAGYGGYASYAAPVGGYSVAQPAYGYGGLAAYGAPRVGGYYSSTSSVDDDLVYAGGAGAYGGQYAAASAYVQQRPAPVQVAAPVATGPVLTGLPAASSFGGASGGMEQYGVNLAPQIEAAYEAAALHRRQPVVRRQVIQVPGPQGQVRQVVRRVPTPVPDVIERVFVVKPQRDVVNLVIERPSTPPPQIKTRTVIAKQRRPLIHSQVVRVAPRVQYQQPQLQYAPQPVVQPVVQQPALAYAAVQQPSYGYDYAPQGYESYSSTTLAGGYAGGYGGNYGYGQAAYAPQAAYGQGYVAQANYGLPAYGGAYGYSSAYGAQPAYPAASYGGYTASNAYPVGGSVVAANPAAGNAYYGAGYPYARY